MNTEAKIDVKLGHLIINTSNQVLFQSKWVFYCYKRSSKAGISDISSGKF